MSLILSDEFKDIKRTKSIFVFEDIPYGVPGNTGDVNIVSTYNSDVRVAAPLAPPARPPARPPIRPPVRRQCGASAAPARL